MKSNIKQLVEQVISDNKQFIIEYGGNPYKYLHYNFANEDQGQNFYLTDEEIADWESNPDNRDQYINQINDLLEQYDYQFDINKAADHFTELYAEEIKEKEITPDAIYEWWGLTKDQYSDEVEYEELEKLILEKI